MKQQELINNIRDKSLTTKERGDSLENFTIDLLEENWEIPIKKTKASGAMHGDGDILVGKDICLDGKIHGQCTSVSVKRTELEKISHQAAKNDRVGAIVTPIVKGDDKVDIYVTMKLSDLMDIIGK